MKVKELLYDYNLHDSLLEKVEQYENSDNRFLLLATR